MAKPTTTPSFPLLVKALKIGESVSRTERVEVGSKAARDLNSVLARLRNNVNQAVSKLRAVHGSNFRVESGVVLTDDKTAHLAVVAVTKMDDGEDDEGVDI